MSAPLVLILATAGLSLIAILLRGRVVFPAVVSAIGAAAAGLFALAAPLDQALSILGLSVKFGSSWSVLGRSLVLGDSNRAAVGFLYLTGAFFFMGAMSARPGRYFLTVGTLFVGVAAGSLMVQPFLYAAIFVELAAMGAVLLLVSQGYPARRGALRLLTFCTAAMMVILLAGRQTEMLGVATGAPDMALKATLLLGLGFAILMAVPPFHHWLPAAAEAGHPYALAFVAVFLQSAGLFFLLRFLDVYQWLRDSQAFLDGIRLVGTATVCFGAVWAVAQRSFSRAVAYALVTDFGVTLVSVGTGTPAGYQLALGLVGAHAVGLAVCGLGMVILRSEAGSDDTGSLAGSAHRFPLAAAAASTGLLSLAGFPLTAGFPGRWALLAILARLDLLSAVAVAAGSLAVTAAAIRWLSTLLRQGPDFERRALSTVEEIFLGGGVGLCLLFGLFPQVFAWVFQATRGLTNLVP
jgi:NADH-quinone oxidoreductase subunit N